MKDKAGNKDTIRPFWHVLGACLFASFCFFVLPTALADDFPDNHVPQITGTVSPQKLYVGQKAELRIDVVSRQGDRVSLSKPELESVELIGKKQSVQEQTNKRKKQSFVFELLPTRAGTLKVGPVEVNTVTQSGKIGEFKSKAYHLEVKSWIANEPDAKLQARGKPVSVFEDDYFWIWLLASALAVVVVAVSSVWIWRRWVMGRTKKQKAAPLVPAWEIALRDLQRLKQKQSAFVNEGKIVAYVDSVSDVLRNYLGERFGFDGLESTTAEIVAQLRSRLSLELLQKADQILHESDLVKFAKAEWDDRRCEKLWTDVRSVVENTIPNAATVPQDNPRPSNDAKGAMP